MCWCLHSVNISETHQRGFLLCIIIKWQFQSFISCCDTIQKKIHGFSNIAMLQWVEAATIMSLFQVTACHRLIRLTVISRHMIVHVIPYDKLVTLYMSLELMTNNYNEKVTSPHNYFFSSKIFHPPCFFSNIRHFPEEFPSYKCKRAYTLSLRRITAIKFNTNTIKLSSAEKTRLYRVRINRHSYRTKKEISLEPLIQANPHNNFHSEIHSLKSYFQMHSKNLWFSFNEK